MTVKPIGHVPSHRILPIYKQPRKLNIALVALSSKKYDLFVGSQLGVESLAGDLRQRFGSDVNVEIVDGQFHNIDHFIEQAKRGIYDVIGLSAKIGTLEETDRIIKAVLDFESGTKPLFVLGNLLATSAPTELLERYRQYADHVIVVRGEGEEALGTIIQEKLNNTGPNRSIVEALITNKTPNLAAWLEAQPVLTQRQVIDINTFSLPARDTLQTLTAVNGLVYVRDGSGCYWNHCTFCTRKAYRGGADVHYRDEEQLLAELLQLQAQGVKRISFTSEVFYGPGLERAERLAAKMIERGIKLRFALALRADLVYKAGDPEEVRFRKIATIKLLQQAGLDLVFIGLESGSESQLKRYNKGVTSGDNYQALKIFRELGLDASFGFIAFDPLMTKAELKENIVFIERSGLLDSNFYPFSKLMAFQDAPITSALAKEGLLGEFDLNTVSFNYHFKDPEVAKVIEILEGWERDFYELRWALTYLQRIRRLNPQSQGQADLLKDFGSELRSIEFSLLKKLALADDLTQAGTVAEILKEFDQRRVDFLQQIRRALVEERSVEDENGMLLGEIEGLYSRLTPGYVSDKVGDIDSLRRLRAYLDSTFRSSDQFAEFWDDIYIGDSNELFWSFLQAGLGLDPRVLDVGTGTGKGLLPFALNLTRGTLVGVDLSANMINFARQKFLLNFPHMQTIFRQVDALELENQLMSLSPFDAIIARYSLQFMNIDQVLPQVLNLLKPGGALLFNAFASNFYGVSDQFRATNPFYTVLYFTYKRILEEYLPALDRPVLDELIDQKQIVPTGQNAYTIIGPSIVQDSRFDPKTLRETLTRVGFTDIEFMPAPEQYPVSEKLRHALLVSSMPFYWGIFGKFTPTLKEEIILKTYDELPPPFGRDKTTIVTDVFVAAKKPF